MLHANPIVFVVDDDVSVRESLELMISSAGWQPETFSSAAEFLCRPRVQVPSCLILDVNLPDLNGLDLQMRVAGRAERDANHIHYRVWQRANDGARDEGRRGGVLNEAIHR